MMPLNPLGGPYRGPLGATTTGFCMMLLLAIWSLHVEVFDAAHEGPPATWTHVDAEDVVTVRWTLNFNI